MPEENAKASVPFSISLKSVSKISLVGLLVLAYSYLNSPGVICLKVDERFIKEKKAFY